MPIWARFESGVRLVHDRRRQLQRAHVCVQVACMSPVPAPAGSLSMPLDVLDLCIMAAMAAMAAMAGYLLPSGCKYRPACLLTVYTVDTCTHTPLHNNGVLPALYACLASASASAPHSDPKPAVDTPFVHQRCCCSRWCKPAWICTLTETLALSRLLTTSRPPEQRGAVQRIKVVVVAVAVAVAVSQCHSAGRRSVSVAVPVVTTACHV